MQSLNNSIQDSVVRIVSVSGGHGFRQRMSELGIIPNSFIKIIKNDNTGPIIVIVKNARIAIGRGMGKRIFYEQE